MKYIVAGVIFVICTLTGYNYGNKLTANTEKMSHVLLFLTFCENELTYLHASSSVILKNFTKQNESSLLFIDDCLNLIEYHDFPEAWCESIKNNKDGFDKSSVELLKNFGKKIGTSDIENQIQIIKYYIFLFEEKFEKAKQIEKANRKLYIMLGITSGLTIAIMLL